MQTFFSIALTLFLVIDALGNIPSFMPFVQQLKTKKRIFLTIRELCFSLVIMVFFYYFGQLLLSWLKTTKVTVEISAGIILFIIALRLIFEQKEESQTKWLQGDPFIVPIATPIIAGPSVLAVIMMLSQDDITQITVLFAILISLFASGVIFCFAPIIQRLIKNRGLFACQRLMGLIVAIIAIQHLLIGIKELVNK